jgi:hypothetical protein
MVVSGINPKIQIILISLHSNKHSLKDIVDFTTRLGLQTSDSNNKAQRTETPGALNKYTTKLHVLLGCYVVFLVNCFPVFRDAVLVSYARVEL